MGRRRTGNADEARQRREGRTESPEGDRDRPRRYLGSAQGADALDRAKAGDPAAVDAVLDAVRPMIVATAERQLATGDVPSADAAEDVAQLTLLRVARHLAECRAESPFQFAAWALAIARRAVLDVRREPLGEAASLRTSLDRLVVRGAERVLADDAPEVGGALDGSPAVVAVLRAALAAYAKTGPETAELVWMRVVAGATWNEVGRAMRIPAGAAKRRYQRAQVGLRAGTLRHIEALPADLRDRAHALVREWES